MLSKQLEPSACEETYKFLGFGMHLPCRAKLQIGVANVGGSSFGTDPRFFYIVLELVQFVWRIR